MISRPKENEETAILIPGMIIPEMVLSFADSLKVNCKVQVVYRKKYAETEEKDTRLKCGLALLDMDIEEHQKILAFLQQATDSNSYLGSHVDTEALWDFFFEADFIYPQKYTFLRANKDKIKETYEKLYTLNPTIAKHFIYKRNDRILGHMAMVRCYENSWLIHHHASSDSVCNSGLMVLNQVGRFINDSHSLSSAHMDFIFCYFRPENKFPDRVFGMVSRQIKDPKACSLDTFAYLHYKKTVNHKFDSEGDWSIAKTRPEDLLEVQRFYEHSSGGLMLSALELEPDMIDMDKLTGEFQRLGLRRERHLFSLKKNDSLKAVVMANISDIGLNFSDLTNCIQAIIIDSDNLPRDIFYGMLSQIVPKYESEEIPVLLYPVSYAENHSVSYEKLYNLWAYDVKYIDYYFKHLERLKRYIQH
ncbi:hypothetical protein ACFL0M_13880 [Thermodesulfobacteriota bacterium]